MRILEGINHGALIGAYYVGPVGAAVGGLIGGIVNLF